MAERLVWVSHTEHAWILANIDKTDGMGRDQKYTVSEYTGGLALGPPQKTTIKATKTRGVDLSQLDTHVRDIARVQQMTDAPLLDILRRRHLVGKIYTMVSDILIATNPYKMVPGLYDNMEPHDYILGVTEPHIYTTANLAYTKMCDAAAPRGMQNQACLVSGESGAGKTEGCKSIMKFLAHLSSNHASGGAASAAASKGPTNVEAKVMLCNPFLEAFGNAQTIMNDNSSRFGKFLKILYAERRIAGATMEHYLLEKARLVAQGPGECNYHIFYQMLAGLSPAVRTKLQLKPVLEYDILNFGGVTAARPLDDVKEFNEGVEAMTAIGIVEQEYIFSVLAGLLELGNVKWDVPGAADAGTSFAAMKAVPTPETRASLALAAEHLGLDPGFTGFQSLFKALTIVTFSAGGRGTMTSIMQRPGQCTDRSRAMIKHTYGHLFDWLIHRVNNLLEPHGEVEIERYIGILDIFGFEIFEKNSFEQLCINFANEKLQRLFNDHIFKLEQKEYAAEDLPVDKITFEDNSACVALIEGYEQKSLSNFQSFFNLLEEQTLRTEATGNSDDSTAKVTDADLATALKAYFSVKPSLNKASKDPATRRQTFVIKDKKAFAKAIESNIHSKNKGAKKKLITAFKNSAKFIKLENGISTAADPGGFMIKHFAGCVSYKFEGFLDKNKDKLGDGLVMVLKMSSISFVKELFDPKVHTSHTPTASPSDSPATPTKKKSRRKKGGGGKTPKPTKMISKNFTNQLRSLTTQLDACKSHYVRCVKPNSQKLKYDEGLGAFEGAMSMRQLRYAGVMETVRIRQAGYPVRETFEQFWKRCVMFKYNAVVGLPAGFSDVRLGCLRVLAACFDPTFDPESYDHHTNAGTPPSKKWLAGSTKVFGKESLMRDLQEWQMERVVPEIQRFVRGRNVRVAFRVWKANRWAKRNAHLAGDARILQALGRAACAASYVAVHLERYRRREERKNRSANITQARTLSPATAAALTPMQIERMHPLALSAIPLSSLRALSDAASASWAAVIEAEAKGLKEMTSDAVAQLSDEELHALSPIAVSYAKSSLGGLKDDMVMEMIERVDETGAYFASDANGMGLSDWSELSPSILHLYMRVPAARAAYFNSTSAAMQQLAPAEAALLGASQVASLPAMALSSLSIHSLAALTPETARAWVGVVQRAFDRFSGLTAEAGRKLGGNDLKLVSAAVLQGMPAETVAALAPRSRKVYDAVVAAAKKRVESEGAGMTSADWAALKLDTYVARFVPGVSDAVAAAERIEAAKKAAAEEAERLRLEEERRVKAAAEEAERLCLARHCEALARAAIAKQTLRERTSANAMRTIAGFLDMVCTRQTITTWHQEMDRACSAQEDAVGASTSRIKALLVREAPRWVRIRDWLLEDMVNLREQTTGRSCIHFASKSGCTTHLATLLDAGSFRGLSASNLLLARDLAYNTPLHLAAATGNIGVGVARLILQTCSAASDATWICGAVNEPYKDSALDIALACAEPAGEMVALLVKYGLRAKPTSAAPSVDVATGAPLRVLNRSALFAARRDDDPHQQFLALDPMSDRFVIERAQQAKEAAATKLQAVVRGIDARLELVATSELGGATPFSRGMRGGDSALGKELSVAAQSVVETCREYAFVSNEYDGLLLHADLGARDAPVWPPAEWSTDAKPAAITGRVRSVEAELRAAASSIVRLGAQMRGAAQSPGADPIDNGLVETMSNHVAKLERRAADIARVRSAVERGVTEPRELELIVQGAASMLSAAKRIQLLVEMAASQVGGLPVSPGRSGTALQLESELRDAASSLRQLQRKIAAGGGVNNELLGQAQMLELRATELAALREAVARGSASIEDLQVVEDRAAAVVDAATKIKAVVALADGAVVGPAQLAGIPAMRVSQPAWTESEELGDLPKWREVEGPVDGRLVRYFYHSETRETAWSLPQGTPFHPARAAALTPAAAITSFEQAKAQLTPMPEQKRAGGVSLMSPAETLRVQSLQDYLLRANLALQRLASPPGWSGWSYLDTAGVLQGP